MYFLQAGPIKIKLQKSIISSMYYERPYMRTYVCMFVHIYVYQEKRALNEAKLGLGRYQFLRATTLHVFILFIEH